MIKKLSPLTKFWIVFILTSSLYMRQLMEFGFSQIGREGVFLLTWLLFVLLGWLLLRVTKGVSRKSLTWLVLLFLLGVLFAASLEIKQERVHLFLYGILGWLFSHDFKKNTKRRPFLAAVIACLLTSMLSEFIQLLLPFRVGDLRDIAFDTSAGLWGALLFLIQERK